MHSCAPRLVLSLRLLAVVLVCVMAFAQAAAPQSRQYAFNMVRQPLGVAINEFSRQTGLDIGGFINESDAAVFVGPLTGRYTAEDGLRELLRATHYTFDWVNERTISVFLASSMGAAEVLGGVTVTASRIRPAVVRADALLSPRDIAFEGLLVTGSRLGGTLSVAGAPVSVIDRNLLEQIDVSTLPQLLKFLPQLPYSRAESFRSDGAQYAELRGLGPSGSLILINGRRTAITSTSATVDGFDLNTLPLAAIERVEVAADAASAVYGMDAAGGLVNVILKDDIRAPVVDLSYGSASGGAQERRLSFSAGYAGPRWRATVVLDYFERDSLFGGKRDRWRDQDYRRFDSLDSRSLQSNPGNITSITSQNLPGLMHGFAAVPEGTSGIGLTAADFATTAGYRNFASQLRDYSIVPQAQRKSLVALATALLDDDSSAFGEVFYSGGGATAQFGEATLSAIVPASNAFNPFGTAVRIDYQFDGLALRRQLTKTQLLRTVGGVRSKWRGWQWEFSALRSDDDGVTRLENEVDPSRVLYSLAASDPDQALNVFQAGPGGTPALLASLIAAPIVVPYESQMTQMSGSARGSLLRTAAGTVTAVVGAEQRVESVRVEDPARAVAFAGERVVIGAFGELDVPLVASVRGAQRIERLSLIAGARLDSHDHFGLLWNSQLAMVWRPTATLALRVSHSTTSRPPSLHDLYGPRREVIALIADRRRDGEITGITLRSGGNPELEPTRARTVSAGATFTSRAPGDLRVAATYWRTQVVDRVVPMQLAALLADDERYADRVVRTEPNASDTAAGLPGQLISADLSQGNAPQLRMQGIDLSASAAFDMPLGRLAPALSATWTKEFESSDVPGAPPNERVGVASAAGTVPRWRATASLGWRRYFWNLQTTARYVSSYDDVEGVMRTGRVVASQTLVDVQATLDLDAIGAQSSLLRGLTATVGVLNVFDREPPFSTVNPGAGYDLSQGDLRQRFAFVKVSKTF